LSGLGRQISNPEGKQAAAWIFSQVSPLPGA
jgi:hypothetical protein